MVVSCDFCNDDATHTIDVYTLEGKVLIQSYDVCDECLKRMI